MWKMRHIDATKGPLISQMMMYALPILLNSLLQQIYSSVDMMVLGNMADSSAVAAVGASSYPYNFLVNLFIGCSVGVRVLLARYIGENDAKKIKSTVDTSLILAVVCGLLVSLVGVFIVPWLMTITKCPDACYDGAVLYLRIYICAAPAVLVGNFAGGMINTAGDTGRTMFVGIFSGLVKVVLDVLLCLIIPNKIIAVSLATCGSVIFTAVFHMFYLIKGVGLVRFRFGKLDWNFRICGKVLAQGLPVGLANCLSPLAYMLQQTQVNAFGVAATAGNSAAGTIDHIAGAVNSAIPTACNVFIGQNLGAQNHDRVKKTVFHSLWLSVALCGAITIIILLVQNTLLGIILPDDPMAVEYAKIKLKWMMPFMVLTAVSVWGYNFLRAFGYSNIASMMSLLTTMGLRLFFLYCIYPAYGTFDVLMINYPVCMVFEAVAVSCASAVVYMRYRQGKYKRL